MKLDFLEQFDKRMKEVGPLVTLCKNSAQKTTWTKYGVNDLDEQINMIFMVLLYVMEQTLKDEECTMSNIADFVDKVNHRWMKIPLTYQQCQELADFIVNVILCNEGKLMHFKGYSFEKGEYIDIHVSYVTSDIKYVEGVRRTSYKLTDTGYNLMFSTLEIESNMKLTMHELIFVTHLKKASYDKAVDDVKGIFTQIRAHIQRIEDSMLRIKQNPLKFTVEEYESLKKETLVYIEETKNRFDAHRNNILAQIKEIKTKEINLGNLTKKDKENLKYLAIIDDYLQRSLDAHQSILSSYYELTDLYAKELDDMAKMTVLRRFNFRKELYTKVIEQPDALTRIDAFLRPLFNKPINKSYNLNKCLELPIPKKKRVKAEEDGVIDIIDEEWKEEQRKLQREKVKRYRVCLKELLLCVESLEVQTLESIQDALEENPESKEKIFTSLEIFREVIVELLTQREIDIAELRKEQEKSIVDAEESAGLQISSCLLEVIAETPQLCHIKKLTVAKTEEDKKITFKNVKSDESSTFRTISCSNIEIRIN